MNVKHLRSFLCEISGSLLLAVPGLVTADSPLDIGWFIEAGISTVDSSRDVGGFSLDGDENGWQLGLGYSLNRYFSVKADYHDLGQGHYASTCPPPNVCPIQNVDRVDIEAFALSATGRLAVTPAIDVYAKLGVTSWNSDFRQFQHDESEVGLLYGAGVGVDLSAALRLNVQYDLYDFDVNAAAVSLAWRFR